MKVKDLEQKKDFVLPTRVNEAGAVVPLDTGWHKVRTLKPVDRPNVKRKKPDYFNVIEDWSLS